MKKVRQSYDGGNISRTTFGTSSTHSFRGSPVLVTTTDNNTKHPPPSGRHSVEGDKAILPETFEGIAENLPLTFRRIVGCIEDQLRLSP